MQFPLILPPGFRLCYLHEKSPLPLWSRQVPALSDRSFLRCKETLALPAGRLQVQGLRAAQRKVAFLTSRVFRRSRGPVLTGQSRSFPQRRRHPPPVASINTDHKHSAKPFRMSTYEKSRGGVSKSHASQSCFRLWRVECQLPTCQRVHESPVTSNAAGPIASRATLAQDLIRSLVLLPETCPPLPVSKCLSGQGQTTGDGWVFQLPHLRKAQRVRMGQRPLVGP